MAASSLKPKSFEQVPVELGAAEMVTTLGSRGIYDRSIDGATLTRLRTSPVSNWSVDDRRLVSEVALASRAPYIPPLGRLELDWYEAEIPVAEVGGILAIDIPEFTAHVPTRRLVELAIKLDGGLRTDGDRVSSKYRLMRPQFSVPAMKGRPMLVSTVEEGPYVEFEGITRLCCVASKYDREEPLPPAVPILLGVGERAGEWQPFYGRP